MKYFHYILIIFIYSCNDNINTNIQTENFFYNKAFDYKDANETDSSFLYFYKAKDFSIQRKDYFTAAKSLTNLAIIQETKGDYFGSQETGISALKYFNTKDSSQYQYMAINYNTLGIAASKLENFSKAIEFHEKAIHFTTNLNDRLIYKNNLANNYRRNNDYIQAILTYNSILKESLKNKTEYARTSTNLALTKWLQNSNYNPIPEFQKALNIRLKEKDNWGLNSSYAHIADYYMKNNQDSAMIYSRKMYNIAKKIESPDDQIEALQKLIILDSKNYSSYFNRYKILTDSLQTARNKAKNQFALIRYETEKNKADFLKAKAESTERQNKIIVRNIALIIAFLILLGFYIYLQKRQKRLKQEKLLEVKNTELKYSKKVHDVVANGLYHTMIEIQNNPELDKEKILNRIEKMYEESRDIAQDEITEKDFHSRFYKMINSYSSIDQRILPVGYKDNIWENVSDNVQSELYYIMREILVNMKKHSQAKLASLKFEKNQDNLTIIYTDNGIGISDLENKKGTGLRNTENRIDSIAGDIIFEKNPRGGLIILITIPTHLKYV